MMTIDKFGWRSESRPDLAALMKCNELIRVSEEKKMKKFVRRCAIGFLLVLSVLIVLNIFQDMTPAQQLTLSHIFN